MKNKLYFFFAYWLLSLCGSCVALGSEQVEFSVLNAQETITFSVPKISPHKVFTVPTPDRLVVDIPALAGKRTMSLPASYRGNLIRALRFGQFDPQTSRFVFDLNAPVHVVNVNEDNGHMRITIAAGTVSSETLVEQEAASAPKPVKRVKEKKSNKKPDKPLIVIDAGHGGVDPGTIGEDEAYEKDLTLSYAQALKTQLLKSGRYRVKLTREDDTFIMLRRRVEMAREAQADMFISIHADSAAEEDARGLSIYTVSEQASDKEAAALAARENKADVIAGMNLADERGDVADILISLAQRDTKNRSAMLADLLVTRLNGKVRLLPNSHRFAGFAVLKAPDIPSVLIEIGFLTNPVEEKQLKSKAYREKVAAGIITGVDAFFSHGA